MSDFVKEIHNMFDHIWDCEIDHPVYQDTVGELMEAVIQTYEKHKPILSTNLAEVGTDVPDINVGELISRQQAIDAARDWYEGLICGSFKGLEKRLRALPSAQPEIIHCEKCQFSEYDALYGDRYCHYDGKAEIVPDEHFCGYGRERQNG